MVAAVVVVETMIVVSCCLLMTRYLERELSCDVASLVDLTFQDLNLLGP